MRKLLFVINTMGLGGAERALLALLSALRDECQLTLLVIVPRGECLAQVPESVEIVGGYSTGSVLDDEGRRFLKRAVLRAAVKRAAALRQLPYLLGNLARQLKAGRVQLDKLCWRMLSDSSPRLTERYDLAVAYLEGAATYYVAEHVNARRKAAFVHIDYRSAGYTRQLDRGCYDRMDRIYAVSAEVAERFASVYPEHRAKTEIFCNLIDRERILRMSEEPGGFDDGYDGVRLLTIGRLHPQKGYDIAIPTLKKLLDEGRELRWYVLGEGAERPALEAQIARCALEGRFVLLGAHPNPYNYLRQADLYVHATRFEGKSIAIEEAQVLGKAIVASDCTGNREQIEPGRDGLLVPLDEDALCAAIGGLLDSPERLRGFEKAAGLKQTGRREDVDGLLRLADEV